MFVKGCHHRKIRPRRRWKHFPPFNRTVEQQRGFCLLLSLKRFRDSACLIFCLTIAMQLGNHQVIKCFSTSLIIKRANYLLFHFWIFISISSSVIKRIICKSEISELSKYIIRMEMNSDVHPYLSFRGIATIYTSYEIQIRSRYMSKWSRMNICGYVYRKCLFCF